MLRRTAVQMIVCEVVGVETAPGGMTNQVTNEKLADNRCPLGEFYRQKNSPILALGPIMIYAPSAMVLQARRQADELLRC